MEVTWASPSDTVSDAETEGVWTSGGLTAFDAPTRAEKARHQVTAYALADGRRLWATKEDRDSVSALAVDGQDVIMATARFDTMKLRILDPATGAERRSATVPLRRIDSRLQLVPAPTALVVVSGTGMTPYHPLQGLPRF
ncbi:PQQ-binding-like beta-propeller repeat protein [Actinocorallia sp. B10E7]|uniref:outer membrane protein assembly factor BamB family protein n=1 Tax=Actinocorallia sp. B10E7 TaxID=3153558 RepID=UPI00325EAC52